MHAHARPTHHAAPITRAHPTPMRRCCALAIALACLGLVAPAAADVPTDLRQAAEALARGDLATATQRGRQALEADNATTRQRSQAVDNLLAAALETGRLADLAAYLQRCRTAAPPNRQMALLTAQARCRKAIDGHLHGVIDHLTNTKKEADPQARRLAATLRQKRAEFGQLAATQARTARRMSLAHVRATRPTTPRRVRTADVARRLSVRVPTPPRLYRRRELAVRKPPLVRRSRASLAAVFLSRFYQHALALMRRGLTDNAKAELATVMQLFPDTTQATQAAQYAIRLFQREHGFALDGQAAALVAYMEWIRAVVGPQGADYAEYMALKHFAPLSDATIVAREADAFVERHPNSKWLTGVKLQLAIALDTMGQPARAIAILKPLATPLDTVLRIKAARILAWLHIFQGDMPNAQTVCNALAAQTLSPQDAADAKRLLDQMAAMPLDKAPLPVPDDAEEAAEALADHLLEVGDDLADKGHDERAMDVYAVYLRTASGREGFWVARQRIGRLKEKGKGGNP